MILPFIPPLSGFSLNLRKKLNNSSMPPNKVLAVERTRNLNCSFSSFFVFRFISAVLDSICLWGAVTDNDYDVFTTLQKSALSIFNLHSQKIEIIVK